MPSAAYRAALGRMIRPGFVVLVGVSWDETKVAGRPLAYLRRFGYSGRIGVVNPKPGAVEGVEQYRSIADLPAVPDVALVAMRSDRVIKAVRQLSSLGVPATIVLDGGFAEDGPIGAARQDELVSAAGHMALLGPNCLGVINLTEGVVLSPTDSLDTPDLRAGVISVASQSGGVLSSLLSRAAARSLGLATLVSTGNEAGIDVVDCLEYFVDDESTQVIVLYIETVRRVSAFRHAVKRARQAGKSVVLYKVGRSEAGSRSVESHTGALAGSDRAYDALFRQEGVIRVERYSDLLDVPMALGLRNRPTGRHVAILTTTGGAGTLLADACGQAGFVLPAPVGASHEISSASPTLSHALKRNPVDLTLKGLSPGAMATALDHVLASPDCDALVVVIGASSLVRPDLTVEPVIAAAQSTVKAVLAYVSPHAPELVRHLVESGVPAFDSPEGTICALKALASYLPIPSRVAMATSHAAESGGTRLNEVEGKALLATYGIQSPARVTMATAEQASFCNKWPSTSLVVKAISSQLAHKSDVGAVTLGVHPREVADRCRKMANRLARKQPELRIEGFLVEEFVEGMEFVLGMTRDSQIGPLLLLGAGGVATEVLDDVAVRLPPVDSAEATAMVDDLRSALLLDGYRGGVRYDRPALVRVVVAFSHLVIDQGERVIEAEINPLVVRPAGLGALAVDAALVMR